MIYYLPHVILLQKALVGVTLGSDKKGNLVILRWS
ncbi:uncharacterized protein METZ01_LOCUS238330, partial [marine metagenome]